MRRVICEREKEKKKQIIEQKVQKPHNHILWQKHCAHIVECKCCIQQEDSCLSFRLVVIAFKILNWLDSKYMVRNKEDAIMVISTKKKYIYVLSSLLLAFVWFCTCVGMCGSVIW